MKNHICFIKLVTILSVLTVEETRDYLLEV
jgi:hypothetical protein